MILLKSRSLNLNGLIEERFQLPNTDNKKLDILVVADTSGSMYHHLNHLGQSLSYLLSVISKYDWQIGITSAAHGDHGDPNTLQENWRDRIVTQNSGRFGGLMQLENGKNLLNNTILTPQTPAYEEIFFQSLSHQDEINCNRPPFCSNYLEQPLRSLQSFIKRYVLDNKDFFRPQADFVSLIITNEDERKEDSERATSAEDVLNSFSQYFSQDDKRFIAYNIIVTNEECLKSELEKGNTAQIASAIARLADLTKGTNISLCSQSYSSELKKISQDIKKQLENKIRLKKEPLPESVNIEFIKGPELGWELSGKDIIFENKSGFSSTIKVTYEEKKSFS
ncbi:MAG: hypothetical protein OXC37_01990 [Bdellovibrionaceae bacterium]|nr:hypothetical protein [Pseudobdellovibrionaceae bacterium]